MKKIWVCLFLFVVLFFIVSGISVQSAYALSDIPYDGDEVAKIKAFLQCQSMVAGKTNAEVLGADINDPSKWPGVSWFDYDPDSVPDIEYLTAKHVVMIDWRASVAGNLDISGFDYLDYIHILNDYGTVGNRGSFTNINITNNPRLGDVYLSYLSIGLLKIEGNQSLTRFLLTAGDIHTLTLNEPSLEILHTTSVGTTPLDFSKFSNLASLKLDGVNVYTTLNLGGNNKLGSIDLEYMDALESVLLGTKSELTFATIYRCGKLTGIDLSNAPKLYDVKINENQSLATLPLQNCPSVHRVEITKNAVLRSVELRNMPDLDLAQCYSNTSLTELLFGGDPALEIIKCDSNALKLLDVSGLSAMKRLYASNNQLTQFKAAGVSFDMISLDGNKLTNLSVVAGGHSVKMNTYKGYGGYVSLSASIDYEDNNHIKCDLLADGLSDPYDTFVKKVEGTGYPTSGEWSDRFTLSGDVDITVFFGANVTFADYFTDAEDNPYGELLGTAYFVQPIVGEVIGPIPPAGDATFPPLVRPGFQLEGWYTDEALTQRWNLENDIVLGEMILYPNWLPQGVPYVKDVKRQSPLDEETDATSVTFLVTFSEVVSGVTKDDFNLGCTGTASGTVSAVSSGTGQNISVTVNGIKGKGTLRLDVKGSNTGIVDTDGNTLSKGYTTGEMYTVGDGGSDPGDDPNEDKIIKSLTASSKTLTLTAGDAGKLVITALFSDGTQADVTSQCIWAASNPGVASANDGIVTAGSKGKASITATYKTNNNEKTVKIAVKVDPKLSQIKFTAVSVTVNAGKSVTLKLVAIYEGDPKEYSLSAKSAVWESSNTDVATVEGGKVRDVQAGSNPVAVTATYGGKTASIDVMVTKQLKSLVIMNGKTATLTAGDDLQLEVVANYSDGTSEVVTEKCEWTSSDASVTAVDNLDNKGLISALVKGRASITATLEKKKCKIKITVKPVVKAIKIEPGSVNIAVGKKATLKAYIQYEGDEKWYAIKKDEVSWKSSDAAITSVDGGKITGIAKGNCYVTASSGGKSVSIMVTVE